MLAPFLIMLREGLEAALITGIIATYLGQTGHKALLPAIWVGVLLAIAFSLFLGAGLQWIGAGLPHKEQELFEAAIGLVAVGVLMSMVFWMRQAAHTIGARLRRSVDQALSSGVDHGWWLIFMVFFVVAREGMESVFFLLATFQNSTGPAAPLGALAGVAAAIIVGCAIYIGGVRLNLGRFFRWTAVLIIVVAAGLLASAVRNLHEAGVWNGLQQVVFDLSDVLPVSGVPGAILEGVFNYQDQPSLGEAIVYVVFLVVALGLFFRPVRATGTDAPDAVAAKLQAERLEEDQNSSVQDSSRASPMLHGAIAGAAVLVAIGAILFGHFSISGKTGTAPPHALDIAITAKACRPNRITLPAGKVIFNIVNHSHRTIEWEIIKGVMVVAEQENIAPGFRQTVRARLSPGEYQITCGLLSNPHGVLRVTPLEGGVAAEAPLDITAFISPLGEYRFFLARHGGALVKTTEALVAAVRLKDGDKVRALYRQARKAYGSLQPVAWRFTALAARIEHTLFPTGGEDGLGPAAGGLAADAALLRERLRAVRLTPSTLIDGAAHEAGRLAFSLRVGGENAAGRADLAVFNAGLAGIDRIVALMTPVISPLRPRLSHDLREKLDAAKATLSGFNLKGDGEYPALETLDADRRQILILAFSNLEQALRDFGKEMPGPRS
ncbi:MAG: iron uptake transporter permease EfeU [Hyphomicrobiales bacterium]